MDMYGGACMVLFDDVVIGDFVGEVSLARRRHTHLKSVATLKMMSRRSE